MGAADARPLPSRAPIRRARGLPTGAHRAGRAPRAGTGAGAARPRARDPGAGPETAARGRRRTADRPAGRPGPSSPRARRWPARGPSSPPPRWPRCSARWRAAGTRDRWPPTRRSWSPGRERRARSRSGPIRSRRPQARGDCGRATGSTGRSRASTPVTGRCRMIATGANPDGIAFGAGSLWVANGGDRTVAQVDPPTAKVVRRVVVGNGPAGVALRSRRGMGSGVHRRNGRPRRCRHRSRGRGP